MLAGFYDGLRLAVILICVGAANTLANPRRLLASFPAALYEASMALVIAASVFPQLSESVQRIRTAQRLRGSTSEGIRGRLRIAVPVLEDALERSLSLAASMDVRGYGRVGEASRPQRMATGALLLTGLVGIGAGAYALFDPTAPTALGVPMLAASTAVAFAGLYLAGRRVKRSRYRPTPWRIEDWSVAGCGAASAALAVVVAARQTSVAYPDLGTFPGLTLLALVGGLAGSLACLIAPPVPLTTEKP